MLKMYIVVKNNVPSDFIPVITAHASLATYLKYQYDEYMQEWVKSTFYKCVCVCDDAHFEKLKKQDKHVVLTESALDNKEVAIAFCPRQEWSGSIKSLKLYKGNILT